MLAPLIWLVVCTEYCMTQTPRPSPTQASPTPASDVTDVPWRNLPGLFSLKLTLLILHTAEVQLFKCCSKEDSHVFLCMHCWPFCVDKKLSLRLVMKSNFPRKMNLKAPESKHLNLVTQLGYQLETVCVLCSKCDMTRTVQGV